MAEWQQMETAPKDGTRILTFLNRLDDDYDVHMCWWDGRRFCGIGWSYSDWNQPTHWMPLPNPPEPDSPATPPVTS